MKIHPTKTAQTSDVVNLAKSRRARKGGKQNDVWLVDAKHMFSKIIADMMIEEGMTKDRYTEKEIAHIVRSCVNDAYVQGWEEFMTWVEFGDDKKMQTLAAIRAHRAAMRHRL